MSSCEYWLVFMTWPIEEVVEHGPMYSNRTISGRRYRSLKLASRDGGGHACEISRTIVLYHETDGRARIRQAKGVLETAELTRSFERSRGPMS